MTGAERGAAPRLRKITPAEHRVMPWKNGLGTTREIAIDPPGAAMTDAQFRWRLSIADVGQSGPFSAFPGIDRTIMVIKGNGMVLTVAGQTPQRLDRCFEPFSFSGDAAVDCQLIDGPVQDFNLMVNRTLLAAQIKVREFSQAEMISLAGESCILHLFSGDAKLRFCSLEEHGDTGDTIVMPTQKDGVALELIPRRSVTMAMIALKTHKSQ